MLKLNAHTTLLLKEHQQMHPLRTLLEAESTRFAKMVELRDQEALTENQSQTQTILQLKQITVASMQEENICRDSSFPRHVVGCCL